tara:strand:+ start:82 stop:330 length:249 start_codon:yes stop_codon:yes gene_type:complete
MKSSPIKSKQKLSPSAAKKKAARDLAAANSPYRKRLRADSQKKRRKKSSTFLKGKDYDHHTGSFVSSSKNRGGMTGKGTKNE